MSGNEDFQNELWRGRSALTGSVIGMAMSVSSIYFYTSGLFLKPIAAEFGWSRGMVSLGPLIGILTLGMVSPITGRIVEAVGPLPMALLSAIALAASFFLLGIATYGLTSFLLLTFLLAVVGSATSPVSYGRIIVANFPKRLGLAFGIMYCGPGLGALLFPPLVGQLLGTHGWRAAYFAIGALTLCSVPIVWFLLRGAAGAVTRDTRGESWNWRLYANSRFCLIAAIFLLASTGIFGTIVHFVPIMTDRGVSPAAAAGLAGSIGFAVIAARLITGYLLDIIEANVLTALVFVISAGGIAMLASGHPALLLPGTLAIGFAIGSELDCAMFMIGRRFAPAHFSTLFGGIYFAVSIGGGGGPILAGAMYDAAGSYLPWFVTAIGTLLAAAVLCLIGRLSILHSPAPARQAV